MRQGNLPTTFELILLAILGDGHWWAAADVRDEYNRRGQSQATYKTIFKTLDRMRKGTWVASKQEARRLATSGPQRILFRASRMGMAVAKRTKDALNA